VYAARVFGFFALASGTGISRIFAYRQTNALRPFSPLKVVRAFLVGFLLALDAHEVWLDAAIRGEDYRAIALSIRCLDSFGEIYFAIHR
jgi:hypothetical protein